MKNNYAWVLLVMCLLTPSAASAEKISVTVKGMVCTFCAQGIKKTFSKLETVEEISVDMDKKLVSITTRGGATLSDETIKQTVNDAGYDVLKIERDRNA